MPGDATTGHSAASRQKRVGAALRLDTRNRLLEAAAREFAERGYSGTTVARLASAADVSVQTLYLAWGSKRELLRGYMEHVLAGTASSPEDAATRFTDAMTPPERIAALAGLVAEIAHRAALGWSLYRDAAGADPDLAADWNELQSLRRQLFGRALAALSTSDLRPGLTPAVAADTAWVIASPESYDLLVNHLHYDPDRFGEWVRHTLTAALLVGVA